MYGMPAKYLALNLSLSGQQDAYGELSFSNTHHRIDTSNPSLEGYNRQFSKITGEEVNSFCKKHPMVIFQNETMNSIAQDHYARRGYEFSKKIDYSNVNLYKANSNTNNCIAKTSSVVANYGVLSFNSLDEEFPNKTNNVPGILYDAVGLNKSPISDTDYHIFYSKLYSTIINAATEHEVEHLIITPVGAGVMAKDANQKLMNKRQILDSLVNCKLSSNTKITILDYDSTFKNNKDCNQIIEQLNQKFKNFCVLSGEDSALGGITLSKLVNPSELTGLINASAPAAYGGLMTSIAGDHTVEENIRHHMALIVQPDVRISICPETVFIEQSQ